MKAWELHKDPALLYEAKQEKAKREAAQAKKQALLEAAQDRQKKKFEDYYFELTGERITDMPRCNEIKVYQADVPNDKRYYYIEDHGVVWDALIVRFYPIEIKPGTYVYLECDGKTYGLATKIFARRTSLERETRVIHVDVEGYYTMEGLSGQPIEETAKSIDLEPLSKKLIKTFKVVYK